MNKNRKAVVGILRAKPKIKDGQPAYDSPELLDTMDLGKTISELLNDAHWKAKIAQRLTELGHKIHSLSILRQDTDGYNIAATIVATKERVRGKPVTRGGRPIGPPVTGQKTMAHHRRKQSR